MLQGPQSGDASGQPNWLVRTLPPIQTLFPFFHKFHPTQLLHCRERSIKLHGRELAATSEEWYQLGFRANRGLSRNGLPDRRGANPSEANGTSANGPSIRTAEQSQLSVQDQMLLEDKERRQRIGSLVSRELLQPNYVTEEKPPAIEPPVGWRAIEKDLRDSLTRCDNLLKRKAVQSGRHEVLIAMRQLMRALDQRRGDWRSEPHMDLALQAFREEADFHASLKNPEQSSSVAAIVASHQTPVLKGMRLDELAPDTAAQYYHQYAKDQFVLAAERHGFASDIYYAYGKCLERLANENQEQRSMLLHQAAVCYQAALIIRSDQSDAANELGYVLLQLDRNSEAFDALQYSLKLRPTTETYRNLAELYRRHGDENGTNWAVNQIAAIQKTGTNLTPGRPIVQEVSPEVFASLSPRDEAMATAFAANQMNQGNVVPTSYPAYQGPNPVPAPPVNSPAPQNANASWYQRMFR